jgi:hypothetical protein
LSWLEHENISTTSDFTFACPRLQAVEEDEIILEVLISRTDVQCSQHTLISSPPSVRWLLVMSVLLGRQKTRAMA